VIAPPPTTRRPAVAALTALLLGAACGGRVEPARPEVRSAVPADGLPRATLTVGAFSAAREVLGTRVLPRFARHWLRTHGTRIEFVQRYEGSGALAQAIADGFEADVVVFADAEDMARLVRAGKVRPGWAGAPHGGIVSRSLVALAVRKGNPKGIADWRDLVRPGIAIVAPDPATSGGGMWNACALYGAALRGHADVAAHDPVQALAFVARVFAHVVDLRPSADESLRAFQRGIGDVAITYESEVVLSWQFGHDEERVVPSSTLLIENPAAVVDGNADRHGVRAIAEGLLQYLWSEEGQQQLASGGLRPVVPSAAGRLPQPDDLWTIADLGGWDRAVDEVLVPAGFLAARATPGK
jgi:sulfate/thiosulfate-binding protein